MVFCTDLGAALREEQICVLKEALAAKQAALQELGKDPWGSPSCHLSPRVWLSSRRVFYARVTPSSPRTSWV